MHLNQQQNLTCF